MATTLQNRIIQNKYILCVVWCGVVWIVTNAESNNETDKYILCVVLCCVVFEIEIEIEHQTPAGKTSHLKLNINT